MALPKNKSKPPEIEPEVLATYRAFIIELITEKGFNGTKTQSGDLAIIGGFARFWHTDLPVQIWISQRYARIFRKIGGKKTDIACLALTEAREINRTITEQLATKP